MNDLSHGQHVTHLNMHGQKRSKVPSRELTWIFLKAPLKMMFLFHKVGHVSFLDITREKMEQVPKHELQP